MTPPDDELVRLLQSELRTVEAEIRRLDQLCEEKFTERDLRLEQRHEAFREDVLARLQAQKEAVAVALTQAEKASERSQTAQDKVNATQNEFRGSLNDYVKDLVTRRENEQVVSELRGLITNLTSQMADLRSRIDVGPPSLSTLQQESDRAVGRRGGAIDARAVIFGLIAAIGVLAGIVGVVLAVVGSN